MRLNINILFDKDINMRLNINILFDKVSFISKPESQKETL